MFPKARESEFRDYWAVDQDSVSVAPEQSSGGLEFEPRRRRKLEAGFDQVLAAAGFGPMPAFKKIHRACRRRRFSHHPVELNLAQTFAADRAGAKIIAAVLRRRLSRLNRLVDGNRKRLV